MKATDIMQVAFIITSNIYESDGEMMVAFIQKSEK
jgi:hypothetical protein